MRTSGVFEGLARLQIARQMIVGFDGAEREAHELFVMRAIQVPTIESIAKMTLGFMQRACGNPEKPGELRRRVATESFGRISHGRSRRFADLIAIFEITGYGSAGRECKHQLLKLVSKLPGNQILEPTRNHDAGSSTNRSFSRESQGSRGSQE